MKSPIKDVPLRNPGETLDNQIDELINDKAMTYVVYIVFLMAITIMEWLRWWMDVPYTPYLYTFIFLCVVAYYLPKILEIKKQLRPLRQGRDGEKVVGQYLELLRETGAKVFHDLPGEAFNLDHVVIASSGIYVIETKTYSKPDSGRANMIFDGVNIRYNGITTDKPIIQVKAARHWLNQLLNDSIGKKYKIKPVIVFPGWFIEPTSEAKSSDVWVLNPKALPTFIANSKQLLSSEEVNLIAYNISRYVRNSGK